MSVKSVTFSIFNKARIAAKAGAQYNGMKITPQRVNKALSVIQQKNERPYHTTMNSCDCPDHQARPQFVCGHILAKLITFRANAELLKSAQSVIITDRVIVDGEITGINPAEAAEYCNREAASVRNIDGGLAYRMKAKEG